METTCTGLIETLVTEKHSETDDPANNNAKTTSIAAEKIDTGAFHKKGVAELLKDMCKVQTTEDKPVSQTRQESKDPGDDKSKTASAPAQASEKGDFDLQNLVSILIDVPDQETTKAPETAQEVKDSGDNKAEIVSDELQVSFCCSLSNKINVHAFR